MEANFKTKSYDLSELTPLTQKTQDQLKAALLQESNICPLCKSEIKKPVLDHQHLTSKETIGANGAGLVRGTLCNNCNTYLGKIENNSKRFQIKDLPTFLINAAEYLQKDNLPYIHSSETFRIKETLSKSEYNRLIKAYCDRYSRTKEYALKKFKYNKYMNKTLQILKDSLK